MIDRWPSLIAFCASTSDVVAGVHHVRESDLEIAVRCGGHGVWGQSLSDGGLERAASAPTEPSRFGYMPSSELIVVFIGRVNYRDV